MFWEWAAVGEPRGVLLLHQGHNSFHADGGPQDLRVVAAHFAYRGFRVIGLEMPPLPHDGIPLSDFLAPSLAVLDRLDADGSTLPVFMLGLSGGAWTTTMLCASDPRIVRGYAVAGDMPWDMRHDPRDYADAEQAGYDYRELYEQAGDRLMHLYNLRDPCCFAGIVGDVGYPYVSDPFNEEHSIGPWSESWIVGDMEAILNGAGF